MLDFAIIISIFTNTAFEFVGPKQKEDKRNLNKTL